MKLINDLQLGKKIKPSDIYDLNRVFDFARHEFSNKRKDFDYYQFY